MSKNILTFASKDYPYQFITQVTTCLIFWLPFLQLLYVDMTLLCLEEIWIRELRKILAIEADLCKKLCLTHNDKISLERDVKDLIKTKDIRPMDQAR